MTGGYQPKSDPAPLPPQQTDAIKKSVINAVFNACAAQAGNRLSARDATLIGERTYHQLKNAGLLVDGHQEEGR